MIDLRLHTHTHTHTTCSSLMVNYSPNLRKQGRHNLSTETESAKCRDEWFRGVVRKTDGSSNVHLSPSPFISFLTRLFTTALSFLSLFSMYTQTCNCICIVKYSPFFLLHLCLVDDEYEYPLFITN